MHPLWSNKKKNKNRPQRHKENYMVIREQPNVRVVTLVPGVRMNKAWYAFESVGLSVVCNTAQNKGLGLLASPGINSSTFPLLADLLK
jgi:hypothetical protein